MPQRIGIIGGGLSGLATAFYLQRQLPDSECLLWEAGDRPGGVIGTETVDVPGQGTFVIDHGADMFATEPPAAMQLCRDLGVEDQLILPDSQLAGAMIVRRGKLVPIPDGFVLMRATKLWQMLTTPLLSPRGKLRFLAERCIRHPRHWRKDEGHDVSVGEFVRHRMGAQVLDRLVGPLVAGIYTADVDRLSMRATMAPILAMVDQHGSLARATLARKKQDQDRTERNSAGARYQRFRGFPRGMQQLIDALVDALPPGTLRLRSPVSEIRPVLPSNPEDSRSTAWQVRSGDSQERVDELVLASPPAVSAQLLGAIQAEPAAWTASCQQAAAGLGAIESASAAIVVLCVRKSQIRGLPAKFGFVVPPGEQRKILAASFASHKYPIRCPADHTIIRVFVGGVLQRELLEQSDQALIELARGELADLIGMTGTETLARVVRWNNAMPQYHVGHLERVAEITDAIAQIPQLHLATNALHGVGIAPVVGAARAVAETIAEHVPASATGVNPTAR